MIALLLCLPALLFAQWVQTNGPKGGEVMGIMVNGQYTYITTRSAGLFRSSDLGNNWTAISNGIDLGPNQIEGFAVYNSYFYSAGGSSLFLSMDNGDNWQQVITPSGGGGNPLCISGTTLYISTPNENGIYYTQVGDTNWIYCGLSGHNINYLGTGAGKIWAGTNDGLYSGLGGNSVPGPVRKRQLYGIYKWIYFCGGY